MKKKPIKQPDFVVFFHTLSNVHFFTNKNTFSIFIESTQKNDTHIERLTMTSKTFSC